MRYLLSSLTLFFTILLVLSPEATCSVPLELWNNKAGLTGLLSHGIKRVSTFKAHSKGTAVQKR